MKKFGIGLRAEHYKYFIKDKLDQVPSYIDFLEIHSENYYHGGFNNKILADIADKFELSLHCIGLSLGSELNHHNLQNLRALMLEYEPTFVSDHLSWSMLDGVYYPDLLPIPYDKTALRHCVNNIKKVQDHLGRRILIENPSSYIQNHDNEFSETEFINLLCQDADCQLLLDINNVYVSCVNHGYDYHKWLDDIDHHLVKEIHLAGHTKYEDGTLVDTHSDVVCDDVWQLYQYFLRQIPPKQDLYTLIEWDSDLPNDINVLYQQVEKAININPIC